MNDTERLIAHYLHDGELSPADLWQLSDWITADPEHARMFAKATFVHRRVGDALRGNSTLLKLTGGLDDVHAVPTENTPARFLSSPTVRRLAACIVLTIGIVAAVMALRSALATPVAITSALATQWAGKTQLSVGAAVGEGTHTLNAGHAAIAFPSGAEAILEGPATFAVTPKSLTLTKGKVVVTCPTRKSRDLVVHVPGARVIDLGTEYAVSANDTGGYAAVTVFEGSVRVERIGTDVAAASVLTAGQSTTIGTSPIHLANTTIAYVRRGELSLRARAADKQLASSSWAGRGIQRRADSDLLLWCDMNVLPNVAETANLASAMSRNVRSFNANPLKFVAGRHVGDSAIEFTEGSKRLVTQIPGQFRQLTLAAWVRLYDEDTSTMRHRALLMSDGWGGQGQVHWQGKGRGYRLSFFARGDGDDPRFSATPDVLTDGGWHLLTTVVDIDGLHPSVKHYVDGKLVYQKSINSATPPLTLGTCSIGGWSPSPDKPDDERSLNGCIDDLLIWRRALTAGEVEQLYRDDGNGG